MSHLPPSPGVKLVGDADFQQLPTPAGDGPTQIELHEDTPEGLDREQKEREGQNRQTLAEAIRKCQELLARISRDCIHVEHRVITKNAFKTKATVGLMLTGVSIDTVVVGGPGYAMGDKLRKGDKITHVDGLAATQDNVLALLVGKDQPGTSVQITVKSAATARTSTLTLTRAATSQIADRCALYEMFTQLKNKIMKDKVGVGVVPQLDSILHLWSSMIVADEEHDNTVASNITNLQDEERAGLDQLLRLLLELQVLMGV